MHITNTQRQHMLESSMPVTGQDRANVLRDPAVKEYMKRLQQEAMKDNLKKAKLLHGH